MSDTKNVDARRANANPNPGVRARQRTAAANTWLPQLAALHPDVWTTDLLAQLTKILDQQLARQGVTVKIVPIEPPRERLVDAAGIEYDGVIA